MTLWQHSNLKGEGWTQKRRIRARPLGNCSALPFAVNSLQGGDITIPSYSECVGHAGLSALLSCDLWRLASCNCLANRGVTKTTERYLTTQHCWTSSVAPLPNSTALFLQCLCISWLHVDSLTWIKHERWSHVSPSHTQPRGKIRYTVSLKTVSRV